MSSEFTIESLVELISDVHRELKERAHRAVNVSLTLRNWMIGYYIEEYERRGVDRAAYGEGLMTTLAERLQGAGLSNCNRREIYRYVAFYQTYPEIVGTVSPQLKTLVPGEPVSLQKKVGTASPQLLKTDIDLINKLSYSHIELLVEITDPLKRTFYEWECTRGNWGVRELRRQISTLYFERSGLSRNPEKLAALIQQKTETASPELTLREPYVFEFLGLKAREVVQESDLEEALLNRLESFLLELGRGFCFEARQKRMRVGDEYFFVDLVFYHRILKCHVLAELKVDEFRHEHLGQLNTYVTWFKRHEMTPGDNPPIGLLLCTRKNAALVEYALAGLDNQLFVNRYQLELPSREVIQHFLERQLRLEKRDGDDEN